MSTTQSQAERRRHIRTQLQITLRALRMDPDGDSVEAFDMTDISRSGIGAMSDRTYYPGQRVMLNMPLPNAPKRQHIYATVVRCRPEQAGYRLGLMFDKSVISVQDPMSILAQLAA
ncbi:MAG: PilZ domain-containing protein [Phycisphaerae bacterium]|nr:PilZ domain-containing protein [Phycisphaerae bacterium]